MAKVLQKYILIGCFALIGIFLQGQSTSYFLLDVGYEYHEANYGLIGGSVYFVQPNDEVFSLSLHANMTHKNQHFIIFPEAEANYTFKGRNYTPYKDVDASFFTLGLAVNPYSIKPKIGITPVNLLYFYVGYGFEIQAHDYTQFQGIVAGLNIKLPLQLF